MNSEKTPEPGKSYGFWLLITALIAALVLPIGGFFAARYFYKELGFFDLIAKLGPLGDYFAGVANPLISLFLFRLTYEIYTTQRKEMRYSVEALESQKKEMRDNVKALEEQNKTLERQLNLQRVETNIKRWEALRDWFMKTRLEGEVKLKFNRSMELHFRQIGDNQLQSASDAALAQNIELRRVFNLLIACLDEGLRIEDRAIEFNNLLLEQLSSTERFFACIVAINSANNILTERILHVIAKYGVNAMVDADQALLVRHPGKGQYLMESEYVQACNELRSYLTSKISSLESS